MKVIDYLFLIIKKKYISWGEQDIPNLIAIIVLTLLFLSNASVIFAALKYFNFIRGDHINKVSIIYAYVSVLSITYIYILFVKKLNSIEVDIALNTYSKKIKIISAIYSVASIITFLCVFVGILLNNNR